MVAVVGAPNAGKSTLVNALVGQKVAITSAKARTTRTRVMGVALEGETRRLCWSIRRASSRPRAGSIGPWCRPPGAARRMRISLRWSSMAGGPWSQDGPILDGLAKRKEPKWLILNKVDIATKEKLLVLAERLHERIGVSETWFVSAQTGDGLPELKAAMAAAMPEGPWHFPGDQVSDITDRLLAAEITREQLYHQLHEELPYQSAVETEQYKERKDGSVEIHQQILVARPTQRGIILGKNGQR